MFKIAMVLLLSCLSLSGHPEEVANYIIDEDRYEDLLDNSFNRRFLTIFFHPGANHGGYIYTESEKNEIKWAQKEGEKAFPLLLEVFKREPIPGDGASPEQWRGVTIRQNILYWLKDFPGGDPQPFVEEIRHQLPEWSERQIANHDTHTGFIREALDLLARKGDAADIPLIEAFLHDVNRNNKHSAESSLIKLKERLTSKTAPQNTNPRGGEDDAKGDKESLRQGDDDDPAQKRGPGKRTKIGIVIIGFTLLGIFTLVSRFRKARAAA